MFRDRDYNQLSGPSSETFLAGTFETPDMTLSALVLVAFHVLGAHGLYRFLSVRFYSEVHFVEIIVEFVQLVISGLCFSTAGVALRVAR